MISTVIVVNCIGQMNFQNHEHEVDLEQGRLSTSGMRRNMERRVTET